MFAQQKQIEVHATSGTGEKLNGYARHFGQVNCPFCDEVNVVAGPVIGRGVAFTWTRCAHNRGTMAGGSLSEVTIMFIGGLK